jgi:hypothetical protein
LLYSIPPKEESPGKKERSQKKKQGDLQTSKTETWEFVALAVAACITMPMRLFLWQQHFDFTIYYLFAQPWMTIFIIRLF